MARQELPLKGHHPCRVTGGQSLHAVWQLLCTQPCRPFGLSAWIIVFSSVQLFLSQASRHCPLTASMQLGSACSNGAGSELLNAITESSHVMPSVGAEENRHPPGLRWLRLLLPPLRDPCFIQCLALIGSCCKAILGCRLSCQTEVSWHYQVGKGRA